MKDCNIFISYIIPCYNVATYLPNCLNSLSKQWIVEGVDIEYIFVNDGSTDETLSVLKAFTASDDRAILVNQMNRGVSAARNSGLDIAKGEYVFFLDSDDFLTDDASLILYEICGKNAPDIIIPNAFFVDEGHWDAKREWNVCGDINSGIYKTIEFAQSVKKMPISFKAYRRKLLIENAICYDEELKVGEVYAFFIHALTFSNKIAFTDKRVMNYTVRGGSVMRTINLERDRTIILTMHRIDECVRNRMPVLLDQPSYIRSTYSIVNMFGIHHYLQHSSYTLEIGKVLKAIKNDEIYKDLQRCYLFKVSSTFKSKLFCFLLYFFPISYTYRFIRSLKRVKKILFNLFN